MEKKPNFVTTWIFSAIYYTDVRELGLKELIACSDALNHAIPTTHEVRSSLAYLEAHGLAKVNGNRIICTKKEKRYLRKLKA